MNPVDAILEPLRQRLSDEATRYNALQARSGRILGRLSATTSSTERDTLFGELRQVEDSLSIVTDRMLLIGELLRTTAAAVENVLVLAPAA